jgi:hypothetical protein
MTRKVEGARTEVAGIASSVPASRSSPAGRSSVCGVVVVQPVRVKASYVVARQ